MHCFFFSVVIWQSRVDKGNLDNDEFAWLYQIHCGGGGCDGMG